MNILDYVLLGVLGIFLIIGYRKGLLRQVLFLAGVAAAFIAAARFHTDLAGMDIFKGVRERNESMALVISFVVIFFGAAAALSVLASLIGRRVDSSNLGPGNRLLGALLGTGIGVLALGGLAIGLKEWKFPGGAAGDTSTSDLEEKGKSLIAGSVLVPKLAEACLALIALVPQDDRDQLKEIYEQKVRIFKNGGLAPAGSPAASKMLSSLNPGNNPGIPPAPAPGGRILNLGLRRAVVRDMENSGGPVNATSQEGKGAPMPAGIKLETK